MNYYPHHIGDFNSATRHLTRTERSIYRDLMDLYYDAEQPIMKDMNKLCRLIIARSDEERTAVEQVLNEFFTETDDGWFHDRCDEEIRKYQAGLQAKSAAGKASAAKRARKSQQNTNSTSAPVEQPLNTCPTDDENSLTLRSTNQEPEPRTNNQEEKTSKKTPAARSASLSVADLTEQSVDPQVAQEFLAMRKKMRAPLTDLALAGIKREAAIVGWTLDQTLRKCIERGWRGFEAKWVMDGRVEQAGKDERRRAWMEEAAGGWRKNEIDMGAIDVTGK